MNQVRRSLTQQTLHGLLWMGSGKAAYTLLQLLVLSVLSRLLTPDQFGVVSAALVITGLSQIGANLGLGPAIVQRPQLERRHLDTAFSASLVLGIALGGVVWLAAPLAAEFMRMERVTAVLRALAWVFPIQALGIVSASLLTRDLEFSWLAARDVLTYVLGYGVVGIATALMGWGVWALVAAEIVQAASKSAILVIKHPPSRRLAFERAAFRDLAYYGGGFTVARLANYAAVYGDNVVAGRYLGPAALGYYGRAYSLMSAPAYAIGTVLDIVLFPVMAKVQDDLRRLSAAYLRGVGLIALLVLPLSSSVILLAPELIHVVLGPRWTPAILPFQVLAIGMLFRTSYKISDSIARSTGAVYRRAWRQMIYAFLVVAGSLLGQRWGIVGVAWGSLAALTVNFLMLASLSLDVAQIGWSDFWKVHRPALMLTVVTFPVVWLVTAGGRALGFPDVFVLLCAGLTLVALCAALAWRLPAVFLGPEGQWMVGTLCSFIPRFAGRPAERTRRESPAPATAAPDPSEIQ